MTFSRAAGQALLAAVFIHGGWCTWNDPGPRVKAAAPLIARARRQLPALPSDETLVRLNAAVHLGAGLLLATGIYPRPAARILALSLIPTTAAGHPAWDADSPGQRGLELIQVVKNAGIGGGLILVSSADRDGAAG